MLDHEGPHIDRQRRHLDEWFTLIGTDWIIDQLLQFRMRIYLSTWAARTNNLLSRSSSSFRVQSELSEPNQVGQRLPKPISTLSPTMFCNKKTCTIVIVLSRWRHSSCILNQLLVYDFRVVTGACNSITDPKRKWNLPDKAKPDISNTVNLFSKKPHSSSLI